MYILQLDSLISQTGNLRYISKVEYVNSFEYKNSRIGNLPQLNLSFQQLESQFGIFELWMTCV